MERVWNELPHVQVTTVSTYSGWMPLRMGYSWIVWCPGSGHAAVLASDGDSPSSARKRLGHAGEPVSRHVIMAQQPNAFNDGRHQVSVRSAMGVGLCSAQNDEDEPEPWKPPELDVPCEWEDERLTRLRLR